MTRAHARRLLIAAAIGVGTAATFAAQGARGLALFFAVLASAAVLGALDWAINQGDRP